MRFSPQRSRSLPFIAMEEAPGSASRGERRPTMPSVEDLELEVAHQVTSNYFDWCPEAVLIVNAETRCIVTANHAFQEWVAPLSAIAATDVLEALFPAAVREVVAQALSEVTAGACGYRLMAACKTVVRTTGDIARWEEMPFDWMVKLHKEVVVLSGRPLDVQADTVKEETTHCMDTHEHKEVAVQTTPVDTGCMDGVMRASLPSPVQHSLRDVHRRCSETEFDRHLRCFNRDDTARRIQEARQFAELKAYGELLRQKDAFMQKIFHEIRTPCHTLQMITKMLLDTVKEDFELKTQLETAWAQSVHICKLADDVKIALSLQAGQTPKMCKTWFPLQPMTQDLYNLVRKLFPKSTVKFQVEYDAAVPSELQVNTDPDMLAMVLRHLLTNAMKFTEEGQVTMHVTLARSSDDSGQDKVTFSVTNTGPPIALSAVYQMGQKYWHGPSENTTATSNLCENNGGFGLGLHIAFNYVHIMGGHLQVRSDPSGTTFWFSIDAEVSSKAPSPTSCAGMGSHMPSSASQNSLNAFNFGLSASHTSLNGMWHNPFHRDMETTHSSDATHTHTTTGHSISFQSTTCAIPPRKTSLVKKESSKASKKVSRWKCLLPWSNPKTDEKEPDRSRARKPHFAPDVPTPPARHSDAGLHVLVVEDNMICQKVVCKCLERVGFSYAVAQNGKMACDLVKENPANYDIVLMDLRMPVMDGLAATQFIRRELHAKMPIIVFSAEVGESTLEQVARAGATDFLPKPATPQMVVEMLRKHCPIP